MNRLLHLPAAAMGAAIPFMFDAALKGALLLAVAALCVLALRGASAATRHLVWLVAVVALLLVPVLSVCLPQWRVLPKWIAAPTASEPPPAASRVVRSVMTERDERPSNLELNPGAGNNTRPPMASHPASPAAPAPVEIGKPAAPALSAPHWWRVWLPLVWCAGCAFCALRLALAYLLLRRATAACEEVKSGPLVEMLAQACAQLGVRQRVRLMMDTRRTIPVVWGVFCPRLVLPAEAEDWSERQLRSVLLHELAHIRRRDTAVQWLTQIVCALHWFNPLVWLAAWRLHAERERACDDLVLASGVRASDYAEHLLHVATKLQGAGWASACGLAMARPSRLEGRLLAVLSERLNRRRVTALLAAVALALGACIAIPLAMLRAAEDAWTAPQAAHIGGNTRSTYCVHDGVQSAFVLFHEGTFSSLTESGSNPRTHAWTDSGRITLDNSGKTFAFFRDHTAPQSLTLNGTAYDLTKGRVFVLGKDGSIRQLALNPPAIRDQGGLEPLGQRVRTALAALPPQTRETVGKLDLTYTPVANDAGKLITPGQGLDIFVKEDPTFSGRYEVGPGGEIALASAGRVAVGGKTYEQAEQLISDALKTTFPTRQFTVLIARDEKPVPDVILPGNTLEVFVNEDTSFNGRYQVRRGGYIILPQIGRVAVAGQTLADAEQAVRKALQVSQLHKATVMIERVEDRDTNPGPLVYLSGEFKNPRPFRIPAGMNLNLSSVLLGCGGLTEKADLSHVKIMRLTGSNPVTETVNAQKLLTDPAIGPDVPLSEGDVIVVPADNNFVSIVGPVKNPGNFRLGAGVKLSAYAFILQSGGFDALADKKQVHILRPMPDGSKAKLPLNISEIEKGRRPDVSLQPGDVVVIPKKMPNVFDTEEMVPQNGDAKTLFEKWKALERGGKVPGALIGELAGQVDSFLQRNAQEADKAKLSETRKRMDGTRDWDLPEAVALLDEIAAVASAPISWEDLELTFSTSDNVKGGQPLPVELQGAAWGKRAENGLHAAWMLEPMRESYPLGSVLKARVLFHNTGKEAVTFTTDEWHQFDGDAAQDPQGKEIHVNSTMYSGVTLSKKFRLAPGEYCEVPGHGIAIGAGKYEEEFSIGTVGAIVEAKVGDDVRMHWTVDAQGGAWTRSDESQVPEEKRKAAFLRRANREGPIEAVADKAEREKIVRRIYLDLVGLSPTSEEIKEFVNDTRLDALSQLAQRLLQKAPVAPFQGKLPTGEVKFRVVDADLEAAKKPRSATGPGRYVLSNKVQLQLSRITGGGHEQVTNKATLIFFADDPKAEAPFPPYEIQLPDGMDVYAFAWQRDTGELWLGEKSALRKYEFHNPASVQEVKYTPWGVAGPPAIRELLEKALKLPSTKTPAPEKTAPQEPGGSGPPPGSTPGGADARPADRDVLVANGPGRWELPGRVELEIPNPAAGGPVNAILHWPARAVASLAA